MRAAPQSLHRCADRDLLPSGPAGGLQSIREPPRHRKTHSSLARPTWDVGRVRRTNGRRVTRAERQVTGRGISVTFFFSQGSRVRYAVIVSGFWKSWDSTIEPLRILDWTVAMMWSTIDWPWPHLEYSQSRVSIDQYSDFMPRSAAAATSAGVKLPPGARKYWIFASGTAAWIALLVSFRSLSMTSVD